jgi:L-arabinokinase
MRRIIHGKTHNLADAEGFLATLSTLEQNPVEEARNLFDLQAEIIVSRAPGRLDVMGGIADYSGSLVLELPIREATFVALQRDPARKLTVISLGETPVSTLSFEMSLEEFETGGAPVEYEAARQRFQHDPKQHWAAYVAGVFLALMRERDVKFQHGARLLIASSVPQGKGVSSSASLEVAVMQAIAAAFEISLGGRELALLCQKVENLVAGAPCGVMDQMTVSCGEPNRLLALLCQPAELRESVSVPDEIRFWGLDSGVRHAVTGSDYGSVRVGAFMGYRIIAELAGLKVERGVAGDPARIEDPRWNGCLANLTPSEFEQSFARQLPEQISGAEFLTRYHGTTDSVTRVMADRVYAVRMPAAHAIYEHHRVRLFANLLRQPIDESVLELLGELMCQSHASYSACGLGSDATDRLVELARTAGPAAGMYGAKITGGGSGGTVALLSRRGADEAVRRIADQFARETGYKPYVFSGSSPGSETFGIIRLRKTETELINI